MKRLFITSISLLLLHAPAALGQGMWHKPKKLLTLGFNTGAANAYKVNLFKGKPCSNCYTTGLYLRRYINRNLSIESGVHFSTDHFTTPVVRVPERYMQSRTQPVTTNIPFAIKYYMGPANKKLRPFLGVGCYYSFGSKNVPANSDANIVQPVSQSGFVPFFMMQGFTYQVNTKIEINETIHFTPQDENHCKQLGFDLGLGFHL